MKLGLRKAWLWTKLILIILVLFWLAFFFAYNSKNFADKVWLFFFDAEYLHVPVSLIITITAVAAIVIFLLGRKILGVLGQLNKLREQEQAERRAREMDARVREVEQKLSSSQTPPSGPGKDNDSGT